MGNRLAEEVRVNGGEERGSGEQDEEKRDEKNKKDRNEGEGQGFTDLVTTTASGAASGRHSQTAAGVAIAVAVAVAAAEAPLFFLFVLLLCSSSFLRLCVKSVSVGVKCELLWVSFHTVSQNLAIRPFHTGPVFVRTGHRKSFDSLPPTM